MGAGDKIMRIAELKSYKNIIGNIQLDLKSRDDIPKIIKGLQHIYLTDDLRNKVYSKLREYHGILADLNTGRPGMELWKVFVMGVLRVNLNWDYDRLHQMVNFHIQIREILGHELEDSYQYKLSTIKDNFNLLDKEMIDEISNIIVLEGHSLLKKKEENLQCRCDSFVMETDVHFPTDINLLFDSIRKVLDLSPKISEELGVCGFREFKSYRRKIKKLFNKSRKKSEKRPDDIGYEQLPYDKHRTESHRYYIEYASKIVKKAENLLQLSNLKKSKSRSFFRAISRLRIYVEYANKFIDQINRRVLLGETIANAEKIYSIFEPYTEWLSKGKANAPVELGLNVCILEDQYGFVLHHHVMKKEVDSDVAFKMVTQAKKNYPNLRQCSFDRGFYSDENIERLNSELDFLVMPKKGKKSQEEKNLENSREFIKARMQHSAVESAINALEQHGLDRCLDHGIQRFRRYVSISVASRNIQKIGIILLEREKLAHKKKKTA